mmetsp:Transcript_2908/g.5449  ORF Transcript_2908/g.5449 Transcript_2908/m.5449 type:complete len:124 (+) Transcript_2908:174-545(+)
MCGLIGAESSPRTCNQRTLQATTITGNVAIHQTKNKNLTNKPEQPDALRAIDEILNHGGNPAIPVVWQLNKYESVGNLPSSLVVIHHHHTFVCTASLLRKSGPLYAKKDNWVKIAWIRKRKKD